MFNLTFRKILVPLIFLPAIAFMLLFILSSCQENPSELYRFAGAKAIQISADVDQQATYAVFSDIHGETEKLQELSKIMQKIGVEGFIVLGNKKKNEGLRSGKIEKEEDNKENYKEENEEDDLQELIDAFRILGKTGLPVLIIPGNHENKKDYALAFERLKEKYPNLIDLVQYRAVDNDDVNFVSLPGYQIKEKSILTASGETRNLKFLPKDGFFADAETIQESKKWTKDLEETSPILDQTVVLLTHGPPKTDARRGPGTLYSGEDAGDENTRIMMQEAGISFALSGHIHEAGGLAANLDGTPVKEGEWSDRFVLNVGSLEEWKLLDGSISQGQAALVTFAGKKAKYEMIKIH